MKPTIEQIEQLYRVCVQLTKMYLPIYLVTLDQRTNNLVILAGEEIVVKINVEGVVDYE